MWSLKKRMSVGEELLAQTGRAQKFSAVQAVSISAILIIFTIAAAKFASSQSIWVDETTQLVGLSLPINQQMEWLLGKASSQLDVPPDRMPPLSYWIGALWSAFFGFDERSLRWMGIVAVCMASPAFYLSGRLAGGRSGGIFALAFVLLSGNTIVLATEIRAYPLFLAFTGYASFFYLRALIACERTFQVYLITLVTFLLLSIYTHFFGVVAACCYMGSLLIMRLLTGQTIRSTLIGSICLAALSVGIVPFVGAAIKISPGAISASEPTFADTFANFARLLFRLTAHASLLVVPACAILFFLSLILALLIGAMGIFNNREGSYSKMGVGLCLPPILAFGGLVTSSLFISSFDVLAPHYNLWLSPALALVLALGFHELASRRASFRTAMRLVGIVIIGCTITALGSLIRNATIFSHGPSAWVMRYIDNPESTLVIHDEAGAWGFLYFPLNYLTNAKLTQLIMDSEGNLRRLSGGRTEPVVASELIRFSLVVQATTRSLSSQELVNIAKGLKPCSFKTRWNDEASSKFTATKISDNVHFCAYISTSLTLLRVN